MLIVTYLDTIVDSMLRGIDEQVSVMKVNILDLFISIFLSSIYYLMYLVVISITFHFNFLFFIYTFYILKLIFKHQLYLQILVLHKFTH